MSRDVLTAARAELVSALAKLDLLLDDVDTTPPPSAQPSPPLPTPLAWGAKVSPAFRQRIRTTGEDFGFDPNWLMACIAFETMETFRADIRPIRNGKRLSSAVGLIQFLESTAQELKTTTDKLAAMTPEDQIDYVWLYIRNRIRERGPIRNVEDLYMSIHWPAAMGKPNDHVMYLKDSAAYAANSSLDINKDGKITKGEAGKLVRDKLAKGLLPANVA